MRQVRRQLEYKYAALFIISVCHISVKGTGHLFQIDHTPAYSQCQPIREERSERGTSASLLLDLPHARYHNHLINLLLPLLRILAHGCVCVRASAARSTPPFPPLSTDFFISSSRSARTDFTTSLSFLPLRVRPRHCRGYHQRPPLRHRVINDPSSLTVCGLIAFLVSNLLQRIMNAITC